MKYLFDQHRELLNEMNLLGSGLLVYEKVDAYKPTEVQPDGPKPAEAQPAKPKTPDQVAQEATKVMTDAKTKLVDKYKHEKFDPTESLALGRFQDRIDKITSGYKEKADKDGDKAKEEAANKMLESAKSLLTEVTDRIKREDEATGDKKGPERSEDEIKKDKYIADNIKALGPALTKSFGFKYEDSMADVVKAALGIVKQETLEKAATDANFNLKEHLTPQESNLITAEILNRLVDRNESIGKDEKELISGLKIKDLKAGKDTALNDWIALKYDVTKSPDGKTMIVKVGDTGGAKEADEGMLKTIRDEIADKLGKKSDGTPADEKDLAATVEANAKNEVMGRLAAEKMQQALAQGKEGSDKLGTMEVIGLAIKMYSMLKSGDWESLNEAMEDFNSKPPKNPVKIMKDCSDAYEKKLGVDAANKPVADLLEAYLKPRGAEADKLFPQAKKGEVPYGRYRGAMCEPLAKMIGKQMGIDPVEKIARDGDRVVIDGNKDGNKVSYHIFKKGGDLMLATGSYETKTTTDSKGKETTNTTHSKPDTDNAIPLGKADMKLSEIKSVDPQGKAEVKNEAPQIKRVAELKLELKKIDTTEQKQFNKLIGENIKTAMEGLLKYLKDNRGEAEKLIKESNPDMKPDRMEFYAKGLMADLDQFIKETEAGAKKMQDAVAKAKNKNIEGQRGEIATASKDLVDTMSKNLGVMQSFVPYNFSAALGEMQSNIFENIGVRQFKSAEELKAAAKQAPAPEAPAPAAPASKDKPAPIKDKEPKVVAASQ
jgi:hypothetical protein